MCLNVVMADGNCCRGTNRFDPLSWVIPLPDHRLRHHTGRSAKLIIREKPAGWIGELHPALLTAYDLRSAPLLFELDTDLSFMSELPVYHGISRYPSVRRDLALVVPESILLDQTLESVSVSTGSALKELRVFDVY